MYTLLRTLLVLLLFATSTSAMSYEVGRGYMVHDGIGCGQFLVQYEANLQGSPQPGMVTDQFIQTRAWIKGYLTAYNLWAKNGIMDILQGLSTDQCERKIADYCEANPDHDLPDALRALVNNMLNSEGKLPAAGI